MNCSELPDTLGFTIIMTGKLLVKKINSEFLALHSEITFEQMGVLYYISKNHKKKIIQQEIAELINKTKSAVLRTIDILEKKRFLIRTQMEGDRRKNIIQLTDKGWLIIEKMHEIFLKIDTELNSRLTIEEQKNCKSSLLKIQTKCNY